MVKIKLSFIKKLFYFLCLFYPNHLLACGYPEWSFERYWDDENTQKQKIAILDQAQCQDHINYFPRTADPIIAKVLIDAIKNDLPRKSIEKVLKDFHCVYGARNNVEYDIIRVFITPEKYAEFCKQDYLETLYIVSTNNGAVLRSGPSTNHHRINVIRNGAYVEKISQDGEWIAINSRHQGKGYIHRSLLTPY